MGRQEVTELQVITAELILECGSKEMLLSLTGHWEWK